MNIEFGDDSMVGRRVVGLWGPPGQAGSRSWFDRAPGDTLDVYGVQGRSKNLRSAYRAALADYFYNGYGPNMDKIRVRSSKRDPAAERRRIYFWMVHIAEPQQWYFASGVVRNPVKARNFYLRTLNSFNPVQEELQALRRVLNLQSDANRRQILTAGRAAAADTPWLRPRTGRVRRFSSNAGGNFGGSAQITVTAQPILQDFTRDAQGFMSSFQWGVRQVNAEVARRFQDELVALMRSEIRSQSGDLIEAHAHPNNRNPR